MKRFGYSFLKNWISLGLYFYYNKIAVKGLDTIPKDKPILFLSNHQNALLDVLLIATRCKRKPWFLARADIFKNRILSPLFHFVQMIPIFRLRDGKASLTNNEAVFNTCGELLNKGESILIFPEANHNLKRRIRPLSKGFTRIVFKALEQNKNLDLYLVPIGQNHQNPTELGDQALLCFGKAIRVQAVLSDNPNESIHNLKTAVAEGLKTLTTHIENDSEYDTVVANLDEHNLDYLKPEAINSYLDNGLPEVGNLPKMSTSVFTGFRKLLFYMINFPIVFIWRIFVKPKVPEQEFMGTFRFGFAMLVYPLFYLACFIVMAYTYNIKAACLCILGHAALNLLLVKLGLATSSSQRK